MSKYTDLLAQIKEDGAGGGAAGGATSGGGTAMSTGVVGPTTAQDGNTSISYIPGGFSKKKTKVGLDGIEKIDDEDEIKEQRSELIHNLYNKLMRVMTVDLRDNKQVKKTIVLLNYWLSLFPNSKYLPMSSLVAVNLGSYDRSIRDLINRIKNIYTDDVGNLEMLMNTIRQDMALNAFEPFAEFDYLIGVRVQTSYQGIIMILELTVNLAMIPTQSIYVESADLLDELKSYRTVKVLKDMLFPVGQMFAPSVFHNIKDMANDILETGENNEDQEEEKRKEQVIKKREVRR